MNIALDSWRPHQDSEGWKQDIYGLENNLLEDRLVGEDEEALGQITGSPSKGDVSEMGEPKTVRAAQRWYYDLQVLNQLARYNYHTLQPVRPTQIELDRYGLGEAYKSGFGSGISMPIKGGDCMEDGNGRVHTRHGVWF